MATAPISYRILEQLIKHEMTGYDLTLALRAGGAAITAGDGYLYPILYMMEQQGLVIVLDIEERRGSRLYYQATPEGHVHYKELRQRYIAAHTVSDTAEEFVPAETPVETRTAATLPARDLPQYLTEGLKKRSLRGFFTRVYEEHIDCAMQHGEASSAVVAALGDPDELAQALQDATTAFTRRPVIGKRTLLFGGIGLLVAAALVGLYFLWGVFVLEVLGIAALVFVGFLLFRFFRVWLKRRRAFHALAKASEANGYTIYRHQSVLGSIFRLREIPTLTIEGNGTAYKIRFVSAWRRLRILKFLSPYFYQVVNVRGIAMVPAHRSMRMAMFFKPRTASGGVFNLYYTEIVEYDRSFKAVPLYLKHDDPTDVRQVEVLLLNPVPLRATIKVGGSETTLVGGELYDGVIIHDAPGFCDYLARNAK